MVCRDSIVVDGYEIRVLRALRRIVRAIDVHSRRLQQSSQVTTPQMVCLYTLQREGTMSLSQLASSVSLSASTTNGIVDRLVAKGFLRRTRERKDRRRVALRITEAGREIVREAPCLLQDRFAEALRELPELEQAAIALSLERIVDLMGARHLDTSPHLTTRSDLHSPAPVQTETTLV